MLQHRNNSANLEKFTSLDILIVGETLVGLAIENIPSNCTYRLHKQETDVGLAQLDPFTHDHSIPARLDKFIYCLVIRLVDYWKKLETLILIYFMRYIAPRNIS